MKKIIAGAVVFGATTAALRHFGPALMARAMRKCEGMLDRMPEDFPPKRLMGSVEEIRAQNASILRRLDEESTSPSAVSGGGR